MSAPAPDTPPLPHPPLPRRIRFAAVVCLMLSSLTGLSALTGVLHLGQLLERRPEGREAPQPQPQLSVLGDPVVVQRALDEAQISALEPMRESRSLVLGALSVACAFTFVAAGRLLRPGGLPLERVRRLLGGAAITAALLRTIDGAQGTVVFRRMAPPLIELMRQRPDFQKPEMAAQLEPMVLFIMSAYAILPTALVAGTFALLGTYFRSDPVRQAVIAHGGEDLIETEEED